MADSLLETYIRQLLEAQPGPDITLAWHGGEPTLMGLEFFRRSLHHVAKHRRAGTKVEHTIETNGVELDDNWCAFFRRHDFLVSLSLDGPRAMHDAYRIDKDGQPTFEKVMRAVRLLQKHGVDFNIMATVHAANAEHPLEVYRFLRDEVRTRFIHVLPIVERATSTLLPLVNQRWGDRGSDLRPLYLQQGDLVTKRSVTPEQWGRFLIKMFDEWLARDVGTVFVQIFDAALASWIGAPPTMCVFAETCGDTVAVEHNGDVYSCEHFVEPKYLLGNYLCAGYKAFFTHIDGPMRLIVDLLRRGHYADEAMAMLTSGRFPFDDRAAATARRLAAIRPHMDALPCRADRRPTDP
jgi:uncharacterized protein